MSKWFLDLPDSDPIERVLRRQQTCFYANSQWDRGFGMEHVPEWAKTSSLVVRNQNRPVGAMVPLEFLCQLAHALPNFIVAKLRPIRERMVDLDFARHGLFAMVAQVMSHCPVRTCVRKMVFYKLQSLEMLDGPGSTTYHNLAASFGTGE